MKDKTKLWLELGLDIAIVLALAAIAWLIAEFYYATRLFEQWVLKNLHH